MAIVVRGAPMLRTPGGERQLTVGDVACFLRGPGGAHQIINVTAEPVRVLMLATELYLELLEYPDSGEISAHDANREHLFRTRPGERVEYWDGDRQAAGPVACPARRSRAADLRGGSARHLNWSLTPTPEHECSCEDPGETC